MTDDYMNEPCPKGGKHDWNLIGHSSGLMVPVVGTILECTKCDKELKHLIKLTPEEHKAHKKRILGDKYGKK